MHFHFDRRIDLADPLNEVVRERIVIIDENNHAAIVAAP
jgi:dsDNA-binding SOS-regulon protein